MQPWPPGSYGHQPAVPGSGQQDTEVGEARVLNLNPFHQLGDEGKALTPARHMAGFWKGSIYCSQPCAKAPGVGLDYFWG